MAGPLDTLLCPPYDVMPPQQAERLLRESPHNAVRLELGPGLPDPAAPDSRYARAAATLDAWIADGTLRRDPERCYYVYEQAFTLQGRALRRRAFFAAVRLTPWGDGAVLPHEQTLAAPKADRLALLAATRANVSPIYALCDSGLPGVTALFGATMGQEPHAAATDEEGATHRLWALDDRGLTASVTDDLVTRPLYIADGHHRYETALAYAADHEDEEQGAEGPAYVLMAVSPVDDPGLVALPTHRLLRGLDDDRLAYGLSRLHEFFAVDIVETIMEEDGAARARRLLAAMAEHGSGASAHAFGLYTPGLARLLLPRATPAELAPRLDPALRGLDVAILQALLFEDVFGLTPEDLRRQSYVDYTRDAAEAARRVDAGSAQLAVLLNPTPPSAVLDVARAGARMPQKSTYFYPKLATGLALRHW